MKKQIVLPQLAPCSLCPSGVGVKRKHHFGEYYQCQLCKKPFSTKLSLALKKELREKEKLRLLGLTYSQLRESESGIRRLKLKTLVKAFRQIPPEDFL